MPPFTKNFDQLDDLRRRVASTAGRDVTPFSFGLRDIDDQLADRGLDDAALHEIAPASQALSDDAAAALFVAGIVARRAARRGRRVFWGVTRFDLYAPGLEQVGLSPSTLLFAEARDDQEVLALMEDALRHGGLAAVVGEVKRADMTATRRLQLAADAGKTPAFLARRWRRPNQCPLSDISAATTRWRIGSAPSGRLPAPGVGRPRWLVELVRQRNGNPFSLLVEACDATGRLALPALAADRAAPAVGATARAA